MPFQFGHIAKFPHVQIGFVPDPFSLQYGKYLELGNPPLEEAQCKFVEGNASNSGDLVRFYLLTLICDTVVNERIGGDVAELGVYKGNTAFLLARLAERIGGTAYLFDTFSGFPQEDLDGIDRDKLPEFADTSLHQVETLVGPNSAKFIQGYFPDSTSVFHLIWPLGLCISIAIYMRPFVPALNIFILG